MYSFRKYYERRSQPPVFAQLVDDYVTATNDLSTEREFLAGVVWDLHDEFQFWQQRMVDISVGGQNYSLARYEVLFIFNKI